MRVMFISNGGVGHIFPMVPLAWALQSAGHEVLVASTAAALGASDAGLAVVDIAEGFDRRKALGELRRRSPEKFAMVASLRSQHMSDLHAAVDFLALMSEPMIDQAVAIASAWQPDLLVQSQIDASALVVAGKLGLPLVNHGFGVADTVRFPELYRERLAEAFDRFGVTGTPTPAAFIDVAPASLLERPVRGWPMRHGSFNGGGQLQPWMTEVGARPRIAVTLGTVAPEMNGLGPLESVFEAATELDAEFVVALGDKVDTTQLPPVPDNVRLVGWVPLNLFLPSCTALIHHGGSGTMIAALDAGIAQIVMPSGADRYINAAAVARRGAGVNLDEVPLATEIIAEVIADKSMAKAAAEVRAEMHAMPTAATMVPRLEALAERREVAAP